MTPENAMYHVRIFLAIRNRDKLQQISLNCDEPELHNIDLNCEVANVYLDKENKDD